MDTPIHIRAVLFRPELFRLVASHACISDFLAWHATCKTTRAACKDILSMDFLDKLFFWCPDRYGAALLKEQMKDTSTVAMGAVALAVLRLTTLNTMSSLHLVCPLPAMKLWDKFADSLGWSWCGRTANEEVEVIRFVTTKNTIVTLTAVGSMSPIRLVASSAESALFTFVCEDGVSCGYPLLTFNNVTFSVQDVEVGFRVRWNGLRGFRYDEEFLHAQIDCFAVKRSWLDGQSFNFRWTGKEFDRDQEMSWILPTTCGCWTCSHIK
ncbi:hypothetical protein K435DRAFT_872529 [Dendrothele bispora CBS 962.96]|uniref:Uncharacterized protein n=1 Tax=Dendrothele bispora (strain CBS 962.96) TaxID=1314807 RepID=A0A4S8L2L6_DENBC|nr:hypothetical protein K435DRAFT_872529 [Dendrothele bispora CBS 962.96]